MAKRYSIAEARPRLPDIVDAVEAGADVVLTRWGKEVAVVVSAARYARLRGDRSAFISAYETFCAGHDLTGTGVDPRWARDLRRGQKE